jgi:hypothetical protein
MGAINWALPALLFAAAPAFADGPGGCCAAAPACASKPAFQVEITPRTEKVGVPVIPPYLVRVREVDREIPSKRMVPVCVTDPCTGCTRTELKEECFVEKVKARVIDIVPPEKDCDTKIETRVRKCVTITLGHVPVCAPAPCAHP